MTRIDRRRATGLGAIFATASLLIAMGCTPRQPVASASDRDVIKTVSSLHQALSVGDYASAHRSIDYRHRLAETLGPLWQDAPEADRAAAVTLAQGMFVNTTERYWTTHFQGRSLKTQVRRDPKDPAARWVDVTATGGPSPPFVWTYRLHRSGSDRSWRVTQREYKLATFLSDTTAFYPTAIRRVHSTLSRAPSLAELNANLPSLIGRMRTRHITIPDLPQRRPDRR